MRDELRGVLFAAALLAPISAPARPHTETTTPEVGIGKLAILTDAQQIRVTIEVACGSRWEAVGATVHVTQHGDQSAEAAIPVECGPVRGRRYEVIVPAIKSGFQTGPAEAAATVTLMDSASGAQTTLEDVAMIDVRQKGSRGSPGE